MSEKVLIITAASKGIGKACAQKLAESGYRLSLMSRSEDIHKSISGENILSLQGDLMNKDDLEKLVSSTLQKFNRIDGIVINTGHTAKGELLEISDEEWLKGFELAFLNTVRLARMVTPELRKQGGGSIVNISSFAAKEPNLSFPVSSVVRASLSSYTKLFATRFGKDKIRMNNVLPGFVDSYPVTSEILETIPMSRPAKTSEIANLVAFLLSEESTYINGQSIIIDGGLTKSI